MKNQVIFGMGILHIAYGLKVLRQAKTQYAPDVPWGQFWLRHFQNLWDNGAKTQPWQNTGSYVSLPSDTLTSQPVHFSLTFQLRADLKLCNSCYCSRL